MINYFNSNMCTLISLIVFSRKDYGRRLDLKRFTKQVHPAFSESWRSERIGFAGLWIVVRIGNITVLIRISLLDCFLIGFAKEESALFIQKEHFWSYTGHVG